MNKQYFYLMAVMTHLFSYFYQDAIIHAIFPTIMDNTSLLLLLMNNVFSKSAMQTKSFFFTLVGVKLQYFFELK